MFENNVTCVTQWAASQQTIFNESERWDGFKSLFNLILETSE